jgi:hypothetical protein
MHVQPSWENRLLFPPVVKAQWKESPMTPRLAALVNRVSELRKAGLKECNCIKEFHLRRIRPLGRQDKCAYECPRMADPSLEPADGQTSWPDNLPLPYSSENPPPFCKDFGLLKLFPDWLLIFVFHLWSRTFTPSVRSM